MGNTNKQVYNIWINIFWVETEVGFIIKYAVIKHSYLS